MTYIIRWSETTQNECCCLVPAGCLSTDFTTWSILNKAVWGAWNKSLLSPPNSQLSASSQLNWGTSANSVVALMRVHTRDSRQFRLIWCSWIRATNRREKKKKKKGGDHSNVRVPLCDEMTASPHSRSGLRECFELYFGATSPNFLSGFLSDLNKSFYTCRCLCLGDHRSWSYEWFV